jgi:hypothetical protein
MPTARRIGKWAVLSGALGVVAALVGGAEAGCGSGGAHGFDGNAGAFAGDAGPSTAQCSGLACQIHECPVDHSTSISGTVFDPAGKNPLYDVVVYVPNSQPKPFATGATCDTCDELYTGEPIAVALTDAFGHFTITNAPDGDKIPLVIQVGKWRKQVVVPTVGTCTDNPQPDGTLRLPRNHTEGDIPQIAISTGASDTLECLFTRVGLDAEEYVAGAGGPGHLHVFQGGDPDFPAGAPNTAPPGPASSVALWDSLPDLMRYDVLFLSCEGDETYNANQQALFEYTAAGGRVFASHYHYAWFNTGPFGDANVAGWYVGTQDIGNIEGDIVTSIADDAKFPKGIALDNWLANVGALTDRELPIQQARHNAELGANNPMSQAWIVADPAAAPGAVQYFTFNTPLGAEPNAQCGRVVYSDLHIGAAAQDYANDPTETAPAGCVKGDLSPQEKALEFMLFDLSSCVIPDQVEPQAPTAQ